MKFVSIIAACIALVVGTAADASPYLITVEQVGPNVVATGSGQIDLDGLTLLFSDVEGTQGIDPSLGFVGVGTTNAPADVFVFPRNGPASFGSGTLIAGSSFSGVVANIQGTANTESSLTVPFDYVSDSMLTTGTTTFDSTTIALLGATPGTYVWTWGQDADQSFTVQIGPTPLPATLPLFAGGLGFVGYLTRRKKRAQALAAA
jgi:hypothetical protein